MDKRNKFWRRQQMARVFKARMVLYAAYGHCIIREDRSYYEHPHWFELAKEKWAQVYKTRARWFDKVSKLAGSTFQTVIDTFTNHYDTILNFFVNRQTNAAAESFNAKVKAFRSQFRGVSDIPFFLFRLSLLCA